MRIFLTICAHICSILDSLTTALGSKPAFLANFTYLQTLELDFSDDGLATQSQRAELLAQFLPATLTVIRLVCLPRIDPHILGLIAARCPVLETLDVTTLERLDLSCCWVCLEESSTCTVHSPIPDMYSDVKELSVAFDTSHLRSSRSTDGRFFRQIAFATALQPLKQLHHLYLGVCLSDSSVFDTHTVHWSRPGEGDFEVPPFTPDQCILCAEKGYAMRVRDRELEASALMGKMLLSLQTVSWASWFAQSELGDDPVNRLTTVWVRRVNEMVEVRRAPW